MGRRRKAAEPDYGRAGETGGYRKVSTAPGPATMSYRSFNPWNNPVPLPSQVQFDPRLITGGTGMGLASPIPTSPAPSSATTSNYGHGNYFNYPDTAKFGRRPKHLVGPYKCSFCPATFTASASARRHEIAHSDNAKPFSCDVCGKRFTQSYTVVVHKQKSHSGIPRSDRPCGPFQCAECPAEFRAARLLGRHVRKEHRPKAPRQLQPQGIGTRRITGRKSESKYFCKICPMTFSKLVNFKEHRKYHSRMVEARAAGQVHPAYRITARLQDIFYRLPRTSGNSLRAKYLQRFDPMIDLPKCGVCGHLTSSRSAHYLHVSRVHAAPDVVPTCKYCGGKFRAQEFLRRHVAEVHLKLYRYESRYCSRVFHQRRSAQRHNWAHERLGVCQQPTPGVLARTKARNRDRDRPRDCELCGEHCATSFQFLHHFVQNHGRECRVAVERLKVKPVQDTDPEFTASPGSGALFLCPTCGNWFKATEFKIHLAITPTTCGSGQNYDCGAQGDMGTETTSEPEGEPEEEDDEDYNIFGGGGLFGATASAYAIGDFEYNDEPEPEPEIGDPDLFHGSLIETGTAPPLDEDSESGNAFEADHMEPESAEPMTMAMLVGVEIKNEPDEVPETETETQSQKEEEPWPQPPKPAPRRRHRRKLLGRAKKPERSKVKMLKPKVVKVKGPRKTYVRRPRTPSPSTLSRWRELDGGRIQCAACQKEFGPQPKRVEYAKRTHYKVHHGEGPRSAFTCEHCGAQLANRATYSSHVRLHTGERPYACDLCPARFPSNPYLFQHKRDVHEKRTYQCSICGKVNKYYVNHSIHMRKHRQDAAEAEASKDLPFPLPPESKTCPQCGKQFVHARRLRSHMNNVHGELQQHGTSASALPRSRPEARAAGVFTCDACPKIFSTFNALKRHKLVEHPANGVKPVFFQCKLCERGFGLVSTIRSHLRKTHAAHLWPSELLQQNSVTVTAPAGDTPEKTYSLETYFIRNKWSSFK